MVSLRAHQLLSRVACLSRKKEEKIPFSELRKSLHRIKSLAFQKKVPRPLLRREIYRLEGQLQGLLGLEKESTEKKTKEKREIAALKKALKQKSSAPQNQLLRKKVEKLSHLVGDLMAREAVKKEVQFEEAKQKLEEKSLEPPPPAITLKKIEEFQERIVALKSSGLLPPEKIAELEQRLTNLEKNLPLPALAEEAPVQHKILFGPSIEKPPTSVPSPRLQELIKWMDEIPLPPPPKPRFKEKE